MNISEIDADCVFDVLDDATGPLAITIQPRTGGWIMWLNLNKGQNSFEEAQDLAIQLQKQVSHLTAQSINPSPWIESPGTNTKQ